ncbi:LacI family DNA-binding transcriptional regulator [Pseudactinotalea sp. Z1748]|uniref:LacI family DNA-binding transcriptional regulator n=1 Tax=Pseudactinotalea sp. Z1748 TaxID=3413027 RepID=UPI003C79DC7C
MSTTIHDVARTSGVSTATVSRALAGSPGVAATTRARVARAARELGYVPNRAARQLVTGRGYSVGLVLPDLENSFYSSVTKGVQQRVRAAGFTAVVADTDEDVETERAVLEQLAAGIDRLILASPRVPDEDLLELSTRADLVLINRQVPARPGAGAAGAGDGHVLRDGIASVVPDNASGIAQSIRHLRNLGHRRIGYAGGPGTSWSDAQRRAAYRADSQGVQIVDLGAFRPGQAGGVTAADEAIATGVSAVLAFNDQLAIGMLGRFAARRVAVPEQISVVGFDDVQVAALLAPALTTVAVPAKRMGARAVDLLLAAHAPARRYRSSPVQSVEVVELQVRASTAEPFQPAAGAGSAPVE